MPAWRFAFCSLGPTEEAFMKAGIVVYRRGDGLLIGQWAHQNTGGLLASEVVHDVSPGDWQGNWPVDISLGGEPFFKGRLNTEKFGDCLMLTWRVQLVKDGSDRTYQGIGYAIDNETMAASFEQID
jgi:hypothetical protein